MEGKGRVGHVGKVWDRQITRAQEKRGPRLPTVPWVYPRNFRRGMLTQHVYVVKVNLLERKKFTDFVRSKMETFCATLKHFENRAHVLTQKSRKSDLLAFPAAVAKEEDGSGGA